MCLLQGTLRCSVSHVTSLLAIHVCCYSAWNPKNNYDMRSEFFVVQFNGFMSLTIYFDVLYIINITQTPHIPVGFNVYLVIDKCVTPVNVSNFSGRYLRNRSTLDIGVWDYISILWHKEHPPEMWHIPPGTPCQNKLVNMAV
jgi:hypothetical protein